MGAGQPSSCAAQCTPSERCCDRGRSGAKSGEFVEGGAKVPGIGSWSALDPKRSREPNPHDDEEGQPFSQQGGFADHVGKGSTLVPGRPSDVILKYSDRSMYRGQVLDGKRHGEGVWTSQSSQYEGQWSHDHQDGEGKEVWQDGRMFHGQFARGKFHGNGKMEWRTLSGIMSYEGQYLEDMKHGRGRFVWADARVYDGEWDRGMRSGKGTYINGKGLSRDGIWKDDKLTSWATPEVLSGQHTIEG
mmetsp:Transcript_27989/g.63339  ORF Transcript_27989/g.63339 Transcript_27989/m.63339 type:complete len:245 (-) Transcript_27989:138-872(-)